MEGFYALFYTGIAGFGHAILVLKDGLVTGADATGGLYDGTYLKTDEGIDFKVTLETPAGATLVTGQSLTEPHRQEISAQLSVSFANGQPVPVQTPLGSVNVIFKKLREV